MIDANPALGVIALLVIAALAILAAYLLEETDTGQRFMDRVEERIGR